MRGSSYRPCDILTSFGVFLRMALDLNLNVRSTVKPKDSMHARELLNRTRVWLNCYNVDRSMGTQHGRAPTIPNDDWIASHSEDWWKSSKLNIKGFDIHTSAYTSELRVVSRFRAKIYSDPDSPTGLNKVPCPLPPIEIHALITLFRTLTSEPWPVRQTTIW